MIADRVAGFERRSRPKWVRFRGMVESLGRRVPPGQVLPLARLYRDVAADLSAARSLGARPEILEELNALVAAGHSIVYRGDAERSALSGRSAFSFLLGEFPRRILAHGRLVLLSTGLFLVPALFAYARVAADPGEIHHLFPSLEHVIRPDAPERPASIGAMPLFTSSILVNNLLACFFAFASGIVLGLGTVYMLALNGILLGALAAHFGNRGRLASFWPQVLPHGITELLAVFVAASAGLLLARAIWRPGEWSRRDALLLAGREAAGLLLGVVALLVLSAIVEGYLTRALARDLPRNLFAAAAAAAAAAWLARAKLSPAPEGPREDQSRARALRSR